MKNLEEKIRTFELSRTPKSWYPASRSINPVFPQISKLDDMSRYNSANYNVFYYKNYPNRQGTPIKSNKQTHSRGYYKSLDPAKQKITYLLSSSPTISPQTKLSIMSQALSAQLRPHTSPPKIVKISSGQSGSTMNDFHKRETNQGYARNTSGGFYTR